MRRLSEITAPILPAGVSVRPCARRPLKSFAGNLTTLVLVVHQSTDTALFVSDSGDVVSAVWVPRALLSIDKADRGRFIIATMSLPLAQQKRFAPYRVRSETLLPEEREKLAEASAAAARARNALRGYRPGSRPTWSGGRNVFA